MKKILGLTIAALLVMALVGGGTWAYFSDPETSIGNILSAGTLDLNIDGGDVNKVILATSITDVIPGSNASDSALLNKTGTVAGELDISFGTVDSEENVRIVDAESAIDATEAAGEGELDANIWFAFWLDYQNNASWDNASDVGLKSDVTTYNWSAATTDIATSGGTTTTIVVSEADLVADAYKGYPITVTTGSKGTRVCTGNTTDTITVARPFTSAIATDDSFDILSGPHYDLASAYSTDSFNAVVANMSDDYDFTIEWVVPVTVGNVIMSDDVTVDLTFTLEQTDAD